MQPRSDRKGYGKGSRAKLDRKPLQGVQKPTADKKKGGKLTSVKNQIRAVKRLLAKGSLAPKALAQQEKRLQELTDDLENHKRSDLQRKYAVKYHRVRFFERVKIERRIAKLEKQAAEETEPAAAEQGAAERAEKLAELREDLQYVTHFPKGEKYVSLLKQSDDPEAQAALDAERNRLRALVRAQLADAAMVAEPDEGRSLAPANAAFTQAGDRSDDEQDDFFLDAGDDAAAGSASPGAHTASRAASIGASASAPSDIWAVDKQQQQQKQSGRQGQAGSLRHTAGVVKARHQPTAKHMQHRQKRSQQILHAPPVAKQKVRPEQRRNPQQQPPQPQQPQLTVKASATASPTTRLESHERSAGKLRFQRPAQASRDRLTASGVAAMTPKRKTLPLQELVPKAGLPLRTRAEGGRKRRKKK